MNSPRHASAGIAGQRACDECRNRKIRCDRASPCSHCRATGLSCRTTTQRPKENKDRVQITKQYENKIDRIESRLANIEQLLRQSPGIRALTPTSAYTSTARNDNTADTSDLDDKSKEQTPATGDIGLRAESVAAKNVFEHTISQDLTAQRDPQLSSALASLRRMVERTQFDGSTSLTDMNTDSKAEFVSHVPRPDWNQVKALLEKAESRTRPNSFDLISPALLETFCQKCRRIYEQGHEGTPKEKLLVYSGLSNITSQIISEEPRERTEYYRNLIQGFQSHLMQALSSFPMLTPASMETAEVILSAALTTTGMCKPSLSWSLSCAAVRVCQTLGYHRLSRADPKLDSMFSRKVMLFWQIYNMDRHNSIRLGHAPAIQDQDIDTPMITVSAEYPPVVVALVKFWVEYGRVQGKICTQLYGPAASQLAHEDQARLAEAFADELEQIRQRKIQANSDLEPFPSNDSERSTKELWTHGGEIMHLSILTTALCAIPLNHPRRFRAIEAARECLRVVRNISNEYSDDPHTWTAICHWELLRTPLTPFIGLFYNSIAHYQTSQNDIGLLEGFITSLEPARTLSSSVEKYYQLCSTFVEVAKAYVRAKMQEQFGEYNNDLAGETVVRSLEPTIGEFDEYLTALGLFGPSFATVDPETVVADSTASGNHMSVSNSGQQQQISEQANLSDWYLGNVSLYGLLEQDFSGLNDMGFDGFDDGMDYT